MRESLLGAERISGAGTDVDSPIVRGGFIHVSLSI